MNGSQREFVDELHLNPEKMWDYKEMLKLEFMLLCCQVMVTILNSYLMTFGSAKCQKNDGNRYCKFFFLNFKKN